MTLWTPHSFDALEFTRVPKLKNHTFPVCDIVCMCSTFRYGKSWTQLTQLTSQHSHQNQGFFREPCGIPWFPCLTVWLPLDSQWLTTLTLSTYSSLCDMIMTLLWHPAIRLDAALRLRQAFALASKNRQYPTWETWRLRHSILSNPWPWMESDLESLVSCNFAFCCFYNLVSIVENEQGVYELSGNIKLTMLR